MIERLRKPGLPETEPAAARNQANAAQTAAPSGRGPAKLDPLVEALGQAVARNATRERTLSAA